MEPRLKQGSKYMFYWLVSTCQTQTLITDKYTAKQQTTATKYRSVTQTTNNRYALN